VEQMKENDYGLTLLVIIVMILLLWK